MPESARAPGAGRVSVSVDDAARGAAKKEVERKEGIRSVDVSYRAAASSKKEAGRKEATAKMKEAPKQATAIKEAQKNAPARESENSPPKTQSHQLKTDVESCGRLFRPWPSTKITVTVNPSVNARPCESCGAGPSVYAGATVTSDPRSVAIRFIRRPRSLSSRRTSDRVASPGMWHLSPSWQTSRGARHIPSIGQVKSGARTRPSLDSEWPRGCRCEHY